MSAKIILTVKEGLLSEKEYVIDHRVVGSIGRAGDCYLRLPSDWIHMDVSRHHCLLDVDPPEIRVRDCGSRNGTFVNGIKIGQRERRERLDDAVPNAGEFELKDGDELRVGHTVFCVHVEDADEPEAYAAGREFLAVCSR